MKLKLKLMGEQEKGENQFLDWEDLLAALIRWVG